MEAPANLIDALSAKLALPASAIEIGAYFHSHRCFRVKSERGNFFLKDCRRLEPEAARLRQGCGFRVYSDEAAVYDLLESSAITAAPRRLGALTTDDGDWLMLELIEGKRLWHFPFGSERWQEAARTGARLSARFAATLDPSLQHSHRLIEDARAIWEPARQKALAASPEIAALIADNASAFAAALATVQAGPSAWLHGQFYTINLLVPDKSDQVYVVDWESFAYGPALFDLACLLFFRHEGDEVREPLIAAYGDCDRRLLHATELFNQLWLLATIGESWWHTPQDPSLAQTRIALTRDALTDGLRRWNSRH